MFARAIESFDDVREMIEGIFKLVDARSRTKSVPWEIRSNNMVFVG